MSERSWDEFLQDQKGEGYEDYYTVGELAQLINYSPDTIKRWMKRGKIPQPAATSPRGWYLWSREQANEILRSLVRR